MGVGNSGSGNADWDRKRDRKFTDKRDEKNDSSRGYDKPRESHNSIGGGSSTSNPSVGGGYSSRTSGGGIGGSDNLRGGSSTTGAPTQNTVSGRDLGSSG